MFDPFQNEPSVDVSLNVEKLPPHVAREVERIQRDQPEVLRQMLEFAVMRQLVRDSLSETLSR